MPREISIEDEFAHSVWCGNLDSTLFLWKYSLAKRGSLTRFRRSLREQHLTASELDTLNWARTKELLHYVYAKVPFYQNRFDSIGLHPSDIVAPEHYLQVPVLRKQEVRENLKTLISLDAKPGDLRLSTTGGSTGEPLGVYHEKRVARAAMEWRMLLWWGLRPGLTYASVYRQQFVTLRDRAGNWLMNWPGKRLHLDASDLTPESMRTFLGSFAAHRPKLLHGYAGAIDRLAEFVLDESIPLPPPKVVWVTSSPTTGVQRQRIEKAFGAPVCDQYGCCEIYWLAAQCPVRQGLHMFTDARRIEFLNALGQPTPADEMGEIVITDLENSLFPLIRYAVGDYGRKLSSACSCGVTLPLMGQVQGRVTDMVTSSTGRCVSGDFLTTVFDEYPEAIRRFQVYQHSDFRIELRVVPNPHFDRSEVVIEKVRRKIIDKFHGEVEVKTVHCPYIPDVRGKIRFVVSEVKRLAS